MMNELACRYQRAASRHVMTHFHVLAAQGLQQQLGTRYQPWHHSRAGISHRRVRACSSALENGNGNGAAHAADCPAAWDQAGYATGVVRGGRLRYSDLRMAPGRRGQLAMEPGKPRNVLIIKKPSNELATAKMQEVGEWLCAKGVTVYVESNVYSTELPQFKPMSDAMWGSIDFCITLGGDGTLLHLGTLFDEDQPMPPVMSFAMGTLGFLTPFDINDFEATLCKVLSADKQPVPCTLRTRLRCELIKRGSVTAMHHVLNEVVVDRGAFPSAILLEVYIDDNYITTVEADGLIIATPSGSTAYSMSVGGSLIAPSVPCTILSPIAPHSLSFRPVVIPDSSTLCLRLAHNARHAARVSFDGKNTMLLPKGTFLTVEATRFPLPTINLSNMDLDWYEGIVQKLKWNTTLRPTPKPLGSAELIRLDMLDDAEDDALLMSSEG